MSDIWDEMKEFFEEPSLDEFSDVMFGFGRLLGGLLNKRYVRMPFDRNHIEKIEKRYEKYACIRSERHLVDGRCPSKN